MIQTLLPDAVSYDSDVVAGRCFGRFPYRCRTDTLLPDGVLFDGVSGLPVLYRSSELTDDIYCIDWLSELSDDSFVRRRSIRLVTASVVAVLVSVVAVVVAAVSLLMVAVTGYRVGRYM